MTNKSELEKVATIEVHNKTDKRVVELGERF